MTLFAAGLSYKTAPVELREQLAVKPSQLVCQACRLKLCGDLGEIVLLSTCNRVEIYGTTPRVDGHIDSLFRMLNTEPRDVRSHIYVHEDIHALRHLFRVTGGLESMVLGETEITGQVKNAYDADGSRGANGFNEAVERHIVVFPPPRVMRMITDTFAAFVRAFATGQFENFLDGRPV